MTQSFTAGATGILAGIDIQGYGYPGTPEDLIIDFYEGSNKLATTTASANEILGAGLWSFIDFSSYNVSLEKDDIYSYKLSTTHVNTNTSGYLIHYSRNNLYSSGSLSRNGVELPDKDLFFRTSLETSSVPEPSTFSIFALGIMGLASSRLKKKSI